MDHPQHPTSLDHSQCPTSLDHPKYPSILDHLQYPTSLDLSRHPTSLDRSQYPTSLDHPQQSRCVRFQDGDSGSSFSKFTPQASAPDERYPLAPLRDDVNLVDPCSGYISAGAEADVRPGSGGSRAIPSFVGYYKDTKPNEATLNTPHHRAQTPPIRPSKLEVDLSEGKKWNSKAVSEESIRAKLGGWTSPVKVPPAPPSIPCTLTNHKFNFDVDPAAKPSSEAALVNLMNELARKYTYTSATEKSHSDIAWDTKIPPRFTPPGSTKEKMADRISQRFTIKRYEPQPEIWQCSDSISPSSRVHQIPLYSGCIGAENLEDVDNPNVKFFPFTTVRTPQPRYTETAHRPNISGYTGKVHWLAVHPANSNLPIPAPTTTARVHCVGWVVDFGMVSQHDFVSL
ncbi:protein SPMIP7 [Latimeria chalumnae]